MTQEGADDTRGSGDAPRAKVRLAALRGLYAAAPMRQRLVIFVVLLLLTVAFCFSPGGSVTITLGDTGEVGFIVVFGMLIIAVGVLYLGLFYGCALGLALGVGIVVHASVMPANYLELMYAQPACGIVPPFTAALVLALAYALMRKKLAPKKPVSAIAAVCLCCIVASLAAVASENLCFLTFHADLLANAGMQSASDLLWGSVYLAEAAIWAVLMAVPGVAALAVYRALQSGRWGRGMRTVFQRWLLLFIGVAFVVTSSVTYCYETFRCQDSAKAELLSQIDYLERQIDDYQVKTEELSDLARTVAAGSANDAALTIEQSPSVLQSTESMNRLADTMGLDSMTVTDGNGTVIADADGQGIGVYNFGAHDQTAPYMQLVSHQIPSIVEQPRASLAADGTETGEYELFAGVPRTDEAGIIQISVPASDYEEVLSAASIEHLGDDYTIGKNGGIIILKDGVVVTSTDLDNRGLDVDDVVEGTDFGGEGNDFATVYDMESLSLMFASTDAYRGFDLMDYQPISEVYAERDKIMQWSLILYMVLYLIVFLLVSRLLSSLVILGIKQTNATLDRITEGDLGQRVDVRNNTEFDQLSNGINATVGALKDSIDEASARIDRELATAHAIQTSSLPRTFPPFPEIDSFDIYATMNPAREVGGDFYDFFLIDDHTLGFVIADVSGKGIPAALFMMTAKTELQNYVMASADLGQAVATVNHRLCVGNDADMFVTAFVATLDFTTGHLMFVNAGHNPPLLRHEGTWEWLREKSGLFLGVLDDRPYHCFERTLQRDDMLLLYTDGVTEAWSAAGQMFGEKGLFEVVQQHVDLHPTQLVYKLENILAEFAEGVDQADDITMLAVEYGEAPDVSKNIEVDAVEANLGRVLKFVHEELARRLCPIKQQNQLDIALEELFVNIAHYAYPDAPADAPGRVGVSYTYSPDPPCITVELADSGVPYDPLKRPEPQRYQDVQDVPIGGLGVMMAKRSVDDIDYRYEHGRNVLTFSKHW